VRLAPTVCCCAQSLVSSVSIACVRVRVCGSHDRVRMWLWRGRVLLGAGPHCARVWTWTWTWMDVAWFVCSVCRVVLPLVWIDPAGPLWVWLSPSAGPFLIREIGRPCGTSHAQAPKHRQFLCVRACVVSPVRISRASARAIVARVLVLCECRIGFPYGALSLSFVRGQMQCGRRAVESGGAEQSRAEQSRAEQLCVFCVSSHCTYSCDEW